MENHERIAIQQDSIASRGNQNWNCHFHILLVKILMLGAQIQHALFVRTEAVQRFFIGPFEFQPGVVGLSVKNLLKSARIVFNRPLPAPFEFRFFCVEWI